MRGDALSHLGNPAAHTPFIDSMVGRDAVSFQNAFCQNPVCVPSRCSFLTGLYPHVHGHRTMNHLLRAHETSLLKELKNAGYYVWMNSRNDFAAGQIPDNFESHATEVYYSTNAGHAPGTVNPNPRGKQGDKNFYSFYSGQLKNDEHGRNYDIDDEDVDAAIKRIKNPVDDKPLCIFLGINFPHPPYRAEEPWFSCVKNIESWKRARALDSSGKPVMEKLLRDYQRMEAYTDDDWNVLRSCYLGMCAKVDEMFRRLCECLKDAGIYDDSLIFFFSDHGDFTGDYNISEKAQNCFEDDLVKVPLIVKPPKEIGNENGIRRGITEIIDFYATVMDFAGITPSHSHFGISLRGALQKETPIREYAFCEGGRLENEIHADEYHVKGANPMSMYFPRMKAQTDSAAHGKAVMIRSDRYKYIRRLYERDEFYDLVQDPLEEKNALDDIQYHEEIAKMQTALLEWYQKTCDVVPFDYDDRFSFEIIWNRVKDICPQAYAEEVRQKIRDGANMFELVHFCEKLTDKQTNTASIPKGRQ
jgi:arylsulfatase A-like enzyme